MAKIAKINFLVKYPSPVHENIVAKIPKLKPHKTSTIQKLFNFLAIKNVKFINKNMVTHPIISWLIKVTIEMFAE